MKLLVHELKTSLSQSIVVGDDDVQLYAIRPHLYRHNWPTGSMKLQLLDDSESVIDESNSVAIGSIGAKNYFHGFVRFDIDSLLNNNTQYYLKIVLEGGYTFSESAYAGWCTDEPLRFQEPGYSPNVGLSAPLGFEVWQFRQLNRGMG